MRLVKPSYKIEFITPDLAKSIESAGRTCYKSEEKITDISSTAFLMKLLSRGHFPMIEFAHMKVRFIADRGFTHELVRHRLASYAQESTRYCNYKGGVAFIIPPWIKMDPGDVNTETMLMMNVMGTEMTWLQSMAQAEAAYLDLIKDGWRPQEARSVLPNSLKTEIVMMANLVEWRHVFKLRTAQGAHPQMRELMCPLLDEVRVKIPIVFDDLS